MSELQNHVFWSPMRSFPHQAHYLLNKQGNTKANIASF